MTSNEHTGQPIEPPPCPTCARVVPYCVCEFTRPIQTKTKILILQHPQEPGVDIGTVPIIKASFPHAVIRTGLSWPNLKKALGYESENQRWGVLYLGSVRVETLPHDKHLFVVDKKGELVSDQEGTLKKLHGIVILDGTWSQAKTLWWRNAWLLKLHRLVLRPLQPSLYDRIRKEPRTGCVSTVEALGEVLDILEGREDIEELVGKPLAELVNRLAKHRPPGARSGPRRDWRSRHHRGRRR